VIKRQANSPHIYASWLPPAELDNRVIADGKKRREIQASTKTNDAQESAKKAIAWATQLEKQLCEQAEEAQEDSNNSLHHFWQILKPQLIQNLNKKRNSERRIKDEINKFEGTAYGIGRQEWSKKNIEEINYNDLHNYWTLIDDRATSTNDMSETKRQQRAILNKLFETARHNGHHTLRNPAYPVIEKSISQRVPGYLQEKDWEALILNVIRLSGGYAKKDISQDEYFSLPSTPHSLHTSKRDFVDLYDALYLMWFWYLRAEDLPRIRAEHFQLDEHDPSDIKVKLAMSELKGYRDAYPTNNWRPDAVTFYKRMKKRRPSGYLVAPHKERTARNENSSQTKKFLNSRLKYALEASCISTSDEYGNSITMHNMRHTTFMLAFLEWEELRTDEETLGDFARNANTSKERLRETYINHIGRNQSGSRARKAFKASELSLIKRVSLKAEK
jgi:integrase